MAFGYALMQGQNGMEGYIRSLSGERIVSVRGAKGKGACALYALNEGGGKLQARGQADSAGQWKGSAKEAGRLFVTVDGKIRLWEEGDETYLRAGQWLREEQERREEKAAGAPAMEKETEKMETEEEPDIHDEPPALFQEATAHPPREDDIPYTLRSPGEGESVDALPKLLWPEGAKGIMPYFRGRRPFAPLLAPGWKFVKTASFQPDIPFFAVGYRAQDGRVSEIAMAYPMGINKAPLPGYVQEPGRDGANYGVMRKKV